ncbi:MAG: hypothetical protein J0H66_00325 [Solirubrobacterales bacterium]|nr:hypothetical protein [Solirubrobacterales bacterium]OJU94390.1 MAG: hypothetical protein BGO23_03010 [Solirubrobacterales bacterium 67-14]
MSDRELGIYLNDHLTGATGGVALARRAAANATDDEREAMWIEVGNEVAEDRETLIRVRNLIGAKPNHLKYAVAWTAEKLGRMKLNGYLLRRSDLGEFLELEMLVTGVTGKLSLWKALARLDDPRLRELDFDQLVERTEAQRQRLEQFRIGLVPAALG